MTSSFSAPPPPIPHILPPQPSPPPPHSSSSSSFSPPSSPYLPTDYLLEIDALELANDLTFAEQLANQINARLRAREEEGDGGGDVPTAADADAGAVHSLAPPSRVPSWQVALQGGEGGGMDAVLSDADVNAVLEEMMRTDAFGDAVYVQEGVEVDERRVEEGKERLEHADERKQEVGQERQAGRGEKEEEGPPLSEPQRSPLLRTPLCCCAPRPTL